MSASEPEPLPRDQLRASDADRQRVVEHLQEAFSEGRLDLGELDERTAAVYAAKTIGELKEFTRDLPPRTAKPELPAAPPSDDELSDRMRRGVNALPAWVLPTIGVIVAINVVIWVVATVVTGLHMVFPWWAILLIIWLAGGRAQRQQRHEQQRRRQQQRRADNEWYDRYHRRSRGYYDSRYRDRRDDDY
jgi:hypothetical protein